MRLEESLPSCTLRMPLLNGCAATEDEAPSCQTCAVPARPTGCPEYHEDSLCSWIKALPSIARGEDYAIRRNVERLLGLARTGRFAGAFAETPCDAEREKRLTARDTRALCKVTNPCGGYPKAPSASSS